MSGAIYKLIELVGTSKESFEDAANNAVKEAAKTIKTPSWLEVVEHEVTLPMAKSPNTR